jgi:hypothetical protein
MARTLLAPGDSDLASWSAASTIQIVKSQPESSCPRSRTGSAVFLSGRIACALGALVAASASCGDSSSPTPGLAARYDLTTIEDRPLPYTWRRIVSSNGIACDDQITAGRLLFGAGHTAREILDRALVCNDGSAPAVSADTAAGQYTASGTQLTLMLQGTLALEAIGPYEIAATLNGDQIRVEKTLSHSGLGTITDFGTRVFTAAP